MTEIKAGQVWAYNKDGSCYGKRGDRYVIIGVNGLMKADSMDNPDWEPCIAYRKEGVKETNPDKQPFFVRDRAGFLERFVFVENE